MSDLASAPAGVKIPVWYWIVAGLLTLWNAFGVFDFLATNLMSEAYLQAYTPEQRAFFTGFPLWFIIIWGLAIFTAFFGALSLLLKKSWAVMLSMASVALYVLSSVYTLLIAGGMALMGTTGMVMSAVIFVILVFQAGFARWARNRGFLS